MAFSCLMPVAYCLDIIVIYVDTSPAVGPTYACITLSSRDTAFVVFVIIVLFAVRLPASASLLYI